MRDVAQLRELVEVATAKLSTLSRMLSDAHDDLTRSEERWHELYDAVAEVLAEEYREAGRKSDPAEHTIESATRRRHRVEFGAWRKAKREVQMLEKIATNRCAELSGYQSELSVERSLMERGSDGADHMPASR